MSGNTEDNSLGDFDVSIEKLRAQFRGIQAENTSLKDDIARVAKARDEDKEQVKEEIKQLEEKNAKLKEGNTELKETNEELQKEKEGLNEENGRMKKQHEDDRETEKALLEEINILKREKETQSDSRDLEQDIQSKEDQIVSLQEANEKLTREDEEQKKKLQEQEENSRANVQSLEEKNAQLSQEKQNLEKRHATTLQNVETLKKQHTEETKKLQGQVKLLNDRLGVMKTKLKEQEDQNLELRKWMKNMERQTNDLKKQNVALQKQRGISEPEPEVKVPTEKVGNPAKGLAIGSMDIVVLQQQYEDTRIQRPLRQLCEDMLGRTVIAMVAASIGPECERQLLVTCIPNHKEIEIDLRQTLDAAKLGLLCPVVVVLHHLAPHRVSRVSPHETSRRLQAGTSSTSSALSRRYSAIIDLVYWNNNIYECDVNAEGVKKLEDLLRVPVEDETMVDRQLATPSSSAASSSSNQPPPTTTS